HIASRAPVSPATPQSVAVRLYRQVGILLLGARQRLVGPVDELSDRSHNLSSDTSRQTTPPHSAKAGSRAPQLSVTAPRSALTAVAAAVAVEVSARAALPVVSQPPAPRGLRAPAGN